jgi:Zn-dependent protease with chaperone function
VSEIYRMLPPICEAYGIPEPELFLVMGPVNAFTTGHTRTSITLYSELLDHLAPDEVEAVLAHECGHILCQHMLYHSMAQVIDLAVTVGGLADIPFASMFLNLASGPLRMALMAWSRKSELSADRAAAAYMGNADVVNRVMFRFAGLRHNSRYTHSVQMFAAQALEYEALRESRWDRFLQWQVGSGSTHPLLAVRVRENEAWSTTEAFGRLADLAAQVRAAPRCGGCGHRVEPAWRHCGSCGGALDRAALPAAPSPIPTPRTG